MRPHFNLWFAWMVCITSVPAIAQPQPAPPQGVVQMSATGSVEVQQDLLMITLNTVKEGPDALAVQTQLKASLDAALAEAKRAAEPRLLDVRTGNFSLYPRHGRDGKQSGWAGSVELILEGRDFARISATAGKIQTLTLGNVSFGLSRDQRLKVEADAQMAAIERFKSKAQDIAKGFGYSAYSLREVSVSSSDSGFVPRPRMMAMEARAAAADAPVPVEAGRSTVQVTVTGSVQLR
ncbi:MAG: hypothetical protein RLZZ126_1122 [Pseudomonadota bacterium]|jgi:predicted secreted protein